MLPSAIRFLILFFVFVAVVHGQTPAGGIKLVFRDYEVTAYLSCVDGDANTTRRWTATSTDPNADLAALVTAAGAQGDCGFAKGVIQSFLVRPNDNNVVTPVGTNKIQYTTPLFRPRSVVSVSTGNPEGARSDTSIYSQAQCGTTQYISNVPPINNGTYTAERAECYSNRQIELDISSRDTPQTIPSYGFQAGTSVHLGMQGKAMAFTIHAYVTFLFVADVPVPALEASPEPTTDTRFVERVGPACAVKKDGPIRWRLKVDRVVGAVDGAGKLMEPEKLVENGVVGQKALLRFPLFQHRMAAGTVPGTIKLTLNGESREFEGISGTADQWTIKSIDVPIQMIRFGKRTPNEASKANENVIELELDTSSPNTSQNWCFAANWAELSFKAMAPVILIHGNGQGDDSRGGEFWDGLLMDTPDKERMRMKMPFTEELIAQRIPYDNSISMTSGPIDAHANYLSTKIPAIAAQFGARHVHLVAHSKGGLDSRAFLAGYVPRNFGVYSLTTISTPHHGSPGPDYQIDSINASVIDSDDSIRTKMGKEAGVNGGTPYLRVAYVENVFNPVNRNALPMSFTVDQETAPVAYRSISADANLNSNLSTWGNPSISYDETEGIPGQGTHYDTTWAYALEQVYRLVGNVKSTRSEEVDVTHTFETQGMVETVTFRVKVVREVLNEEFQLNDFAVTQASARFEPLFQEIRSLKANHSTVCQSPTAKIVLDEIRQIQPVR